MSKTFQEFTEANLIPNIDSETFLYLDIGYQILRFDFDRRCHPGGFTTAILDRNPKAKGHGIALPEDQGGTPSLVSRKHRQRITIPLHDVTNYNLSGPLRTESLPPRYIPLPFSTKFDLVILDAHRFGSDETMRQFFQEGGPTRMILSQLIIALESIAPKGILLMRLSLSQGDQMVAILYIFSLLFGTFSVHKPMWGHKGRGSFYAIADGFQGASLERAFVLPVERVLFVLRKYWWEASFGSGEDNWVNEWWDEIVKSEGLPQLFGKRFITLITPVWETQIEGLKTHFRKHKVIF
jgi:FtsJ-like methyltransferase